MAMWAPGTKRGDPHLHLVAGRGAQEGHVKVEVGGLLNAAVVNGTSWRQPDGDLQQVCAHTGHPLIYNAAACSIAP